MSTRTTLTSAALLAALAVVLGAFAAHGLHDRLEARGQLAAWETAVRYQMWHALALLAVGILRERQGGLRFTSVAFLIGALLFSGSIYCLAFGILRPVMIPLTPIGGVILISGWISLALSCRRQPGPTSV